MFLQSTNAAAMEKSLSALWQRQQLIANNLAHTDTPGYKAKRLDFEAALQSELNNVRQKKGITRSDAVARIQDVEPRVYSQTNTVTRADGNNVDTLAEQAEYTRTQYHFQALAQKLTGYYSNIKYAITGGR